MLTYQSLLCSESIVTMGSNPCFIYVQNSAISITFWEVWAPDSLAPYTKVNIGYEADFKVTYL